jgi:hypothetical protein
MRERRNKKTRRIRKQLLEIKKIEKTGDLKE